MLKRKCITAAKSTFAIGGVSFSADSLVVAESAVLRKNICAEKPAHRKSAKRMFNSKSINSHFYINELMK
jgi:hypothetical protein